MTLSRPTGEPEKGPKYSPLLFLLIVDKRLSLIPRYTAKEPGGSWSLGVDTRPPLAPRDAEDPGSEQCRQHRRRVPGARAVGSQSTMRRCGSSRHAPRHVAAHRAGAPVQPFGVKFGARSRRASRHRSVPARSPIASSPRTRSPIIRTECPPDAATDRRPWTINVRESWSAVRFCLSMN